MAHCASVRGNAGRSRFRTEADMNWQARPAASVANDPNRTSRSPVWNVSRRKLLLSDPLVSEEPALPADAAAISGETSISADDPVARNHNGNRVCGIGQADRTDGFRPAQLARQRPITQRCTGLDRSDCRPNLALKRGALGCNGDGIDRAEIAQEVVADRPPIAVGCGAVLYSEVNNGAEEDAACAA